MDNRGIPARVNSRSSQIWRYAEHRRIQDPYEGWPFYTPVMYEALRVPLSNRRGNKVVEAAEPSSRRGNTETKVVADENNRGNIHNDSASNPVMELPHVSHCPNEDSVDERAQVEALEADIGKLISNMELTEPMPHPPVSSRGRPLKPTHKLLELPNATIAPPLPSKRKRKDGASIDRQTKQKAAKPAPAVARFNEGDTTLNRRPRGLLRRLGVGADVSEPTGPGSVAGQASLANGTDDPTDVVNTNGSGAGVEVGVSEPSGSGSLGGQSAPIFEPVVCVTNRNPMDLPVEEAMEYMRSENRVSSAHTVKLFGQYIS